MKRFNEFTNESLKDKLKGKSKDEIINIIKKMDDPEKKLINACKFHITDLVEELLKNGIDPTFGDNMCLINCGMLGYNDIVDLLLKNDKVIKELYLKQLNDAKYVYEYDDLVDNNDVIWSYNDDEYEYEEDDDEYEEDDDGLL